jgi:hypothetical protein
MNTKKFHGITSLILVGVATLMGLVVISLSSWIWAGIYLAMMVIVPQAILRTYCAKCPCKAHCGHVFPGKVALAFEKDGPYTGTDFLILSVAILLLIGLPQYWLWPLPLVFGTYWLLTGIGLVQILATICPSCANVYCPVRMRKSQQ